MPETAAKVCGTCSMCCKLPSIAELGKPAGVWCQHVLKGKGCGIYEARPEVCRAFRCSWLRDPGSPDNWRPDRCGFVVREHKGSVLWIEVEPTRPLAWREPPFYAQIKQWAGLAIADRGAVVVACARSLTIVLPDKDVPIGVPVEGDEFEGAFEMRNGIRRNFVRVTHADGSFTDHG